MTGRIPVPLWTWPVIAKHFGVSARKAKAWKKQGAPIRMTGKGAYAEAWQLADWLYAQPDVEPNGRSMNLPNAKA